MEIRVREPDFVQGIDEGEEVRAGYSMGKEVGRVGTRERTVDASMDCMGSFFLLVSLCRQSCVYTGLERTRHHAWLGHANRLAWEGIGSLILDQTGFIVWRRRFVGVELGTMAVLPVKEVIVAVLRWSVHLTFCSAVGREKKRERKRRETHREKSTRGSRPADSALKAE